MSTSSAPTTPSEPAVAGDGQVADPGFELRMVEGIRPITEHFLASALHHLFNTGIYDELDRRGEPVALDELADALDMDGHRLRGFLLFLSNEGVVHVDGDTVELGAKGRQYAEFRAWYTMLVGGYSMTLNQMGPALRRGADWCDRDGRYVGLGSCEISRYDGIPMTRALIAQAGIECREVLDLGCGNALYLVEFCREIPGVTAWGVEPDRGGYEEACQLVGDAGMGDRVRLVNAPATDFLRNPPEGCDPDVIVFGYVLQEILAQEGEQAIVDLLHGVVERFPDINIVVIEVANEIENGAVMRHGVARNFWNPYFLLHFFTNQRLEKKAYWDDLFKRAGMDVAAFVSTDRNVDSSGLELGYLLRAGSGR